MSASEEIRRLEAELEMSKEHLREDASLIRHKIDETKAELSPTNLVRRKIYIALGAALSAGFAIGYFLDWRVSPGRIAIPVLEHVGKPAARSVAATAAKRLVTNAVRNKYSDHTKRDGDRFRAEPGLA
jgi:hypothetical protein